MNFNDNKKGFSFEKAFLIQIVNFNILDFVSSLD